MLLLIPLLTIAVLAGYWIARWIAGVEARRVVQVEPPEPWPKPAPRLDYGIEYWLDRIEDCKYEPDKIFIYLGQARQAVDSLKAQNARTMPRPAE